MRCSAAGSRRWRGCAAQSNCGMCWTSCLPRPVLVLPWHGRPVSSCILFPSLLCVKPHSMPWPLTPNRRIPHRWCIPRRVSEAAATRSLSPGDPHGTRLASILATPKGCRSGARSGMNSRAVPRLVPTTNTLRSLTRRCGFVASPYRRRIGFVVASFAPHDMTHTGYTTLCASGSEPSSGSHHPYPSH